MSAHELMTHALREAVYLIRQTPCEHRIGSTRCPFKELNAYWQPVARAFKPWLMVLLASTPTRGVADIIETSIIFHLEFSGLNIENNLNFSGYPFSRRVDDDELDLEYYVYIALKELPPGEAWRQATNSFSARPNVNLGESAVSARLKA